MEKKTIDILAKAISVWGCYIVGYVCIVKSVGWLLALGIFLVSLGGKGEDIKL